MSQSELTIKGAWGVEITVVKDLPSLSMDWKALALLDDCERETARSIGSDVLRARFVATRFLLRKILAQTAGNSPENWHFSRERHGRWKCAENCGLPKMYFSIAHTTGATAVVVSRHYQVGVDIEIERSSLDPRRIEMAFNRNERSSLMRYSFEERALAVLKLWTAKEAYTKLTGLGPQLNPSSFEISLNPFRLMQSGLTFIDPKDIQFDCHNFELSDNAYLLTSAWWNLPSTEYQEEWEPQHA